MDWINRVNKFFLVILLFAFVAQPLWAQRQAQPRPTPVPETTPENDMARFLAGLPVWEGSPLARLQRQREYARHRERMGELWRLYDYNFFKPMREWTYSSLLPRINSSLPLVYFFGGPDAINMLTLFPETPLYLMSGLEPVGQIAAPDTMESDLLVSELAALQQAVETVLSFGHFITKDMRHQLDRTAFRGVLPLIYTFIAFTGGEVGATVFFTVTPDGRSVDVGTENGVPAVRVNFRGASGKLQTIAYCQANLANEALATNPAPLKWIASFGRGSNTYLKAASYLMHEGNFTTVRNFLLSGSQAILQDDSGIPFKAFAPERWHTTLFGTYNGTLDIFKKYHQGDYEAAFQATEAQPLPFGTGYKWEKGKSNLLLATRVGSPAPEIQVSPINRGPAMPPEAPQTEPSVISSPNVLVVPQSTPEASGEINQPAYRPRESRQTPPLQRPYRPEPTEQPSRPTNTPAPIPAPEAPAADLPPQPLAKPTIIIGGEE